MTKTCGSFSGNSTGKRSYNAARLFLNTVWLLCLLLQQTTGKAQPGSKEKENDPHAQYPSFLSDGYVGLDVGYINYRFSNAQLQPGFAASSVQVPHPAVRLTLFARRFNSFLSAQITYMRPVLWVNYKTINVDHSDHTVWMNVAGLTFKASAGLRRRVSFYGEAGLGWVTRSGFRIGNTVAVRNADFATLLTAAGLQYRANQKWRLKISAAWSPASAKENQPATFFSSAGFIYIMHPLPEKTVERNSHTGYIFPRNCIQLVFTSNAPGYGVNDFFSKKPLPIFWGGDAEIKNGFSLAYQRNVFHGRKVFSLNWGTQLSWFESRKDHNHFLALSVYPLLRFTAFRMRMADIYFDYSVAGPTFISKTIVDGNNTGEKFTFRDMMGMGVFAGAKRRFNAGIGIAHYSNGNLFPENGGIKIPLSVSIGYGF